MQGSKLMVTVAFSIIIVTIFWFALIYIVNPFLQGNFITLDDSIALYVDTLAVVEKGSVAIPIESGSVSRVEVAYKKKDKEEEIPEDGWYVIVTYRMQTGVPIMDASRINTYPFGADMESYVINPDTVCIKKERESEYPRVSRC